MNNALFDLNIWTKAKNLAKEIYMLTKNSHFEKDW